MGSAHLDAATYLHNRPQKTPRDTILLGCTDAPKGSMSRDFAAAIDELR